MENNKLNDQTNEILEKLDKFPIDLVEIEITQSLFSSKLLSINNDSIEKILNTCLHHVKNHLGNKFENIEVIVYRINLETSEIFTMDCIYHKLILIGNGFIEKIPTLKEGLRSYVSNKLGDKLKVNVVVDEQRDDIMDYLMNQTPNITRGDRFDELSDKTNTFYHPELYDFSSKGWIILDPVEIDSSFVIFANNK
jgi:hypothetical protein